MFLRSALPRRQVLYLDAIEESVDMAGLAYSRLQRSILALAPGPGGGTAIVLDAWSLVDVLNRLRVMIEFMPGLKKSSAGVKSLLVSLAPVEDLRNAVQHLYGEADRIADTGQPIWGSLSWAIPQPDNTVKVGMWMPGTIGRVSLPVVNPVGRKIELPVGLIELTAAGKSVSLSEMTYAVARFAERLEPALDDASAGHQEGRVMVIDVKAS